MSDVQKNELKDILSALNLVKNSPAKTLNALDRFSIQDFRIALRDKRVRAKIISAIKLELNNLSDGEEKKALLDLLNTLKADKDLQQVRESDILGIKPTDPNKFAEHKRINERDLLNINPTKK